MATTAQDLDRTFLDLPTDESVLFETAEFLAELATGRRMDCPALLESGVNPSERDTAEAGLAHWPGALAGWPRTQSI